MAQLDQAHRILREKLESSQQRQLTQLTFYYDSLEQSLLSPESPAPTTTANNAARASTLGRNSGTQSLRKF
jgi:hypothetical protein